MKVKLVVIGGKKAGMEIPISMSKCLIGRGDGCHIRLQSQLVSRRHCQISFEDGLAVMEDFGSANGTLVNGEKIQQRRELKNRDRVEIGPLEVEVRFETQRGQSHLHGDHVGGRGKAANAAKSGAVASTPQGGWFPVRDNNAAARSKVAKGVRPRTASSEPLANKNLGTNEPIYGLAGETDSSTLGRNGLPRFRSVPGGSNTLCLGSCEDVKEWDGTDLLLLAAFGLLIVVVLSWLFPMSWPEAGRGPRWCLQNWWHTWWLRWGTLAILVAALMKLLCVRAKSERGNRPRAAM